jgi:CheY-like chemotaxis protein
MKEKIMLVEDELITAMDIRRMLERVGYHVMATISSGEEAVSRARDIHPDLIIMDIFLSQDMDGIEASDLITKEFDVPVIFLTANADTSTLKRADQIRHYGYLLKPIKLSDLNSIVTTAIQRHEIESSKKNHNCGMPS